MKAQETAKQIIDNNHPLFEFVLDASYCMANGIPTYKMFNGHRYQSSCKNLKTERRITSKIMGSPLIEPLKPMISILLTNI